MSTPSDHMATAPRASIHCTSSAAKTPTQEVAAFSPEWYGLIDPTTTFDINGVLWMRPVGAHLDTVSELWLLKRHLSEVYIRGIAYEYMHCPRKTARLWFPHLFRMMNPWRHSARMQRGGGEYMSCWRSRRCSISLAALFLSSVQGTSCFTFVFFVS